MRRQRQGFTLVEIMIVVAIIATLAAIAIPQLIESRKMSNQNKCFNNLKIIEYAREQYALNAGWTSGKSLSGTERAAAFAFIKSSTIALCPKGGTLSWGTVGGEAPACTYHGYTSAPAALSALTSD